MSKSETPCPFCGGDAYGHRFDIVFASMQCSTCKAQGPRVKIAVEKLPEGKTWAQIYGKALKKAQKLWDRQNPKGETDGELPGSSDIGDTVTYSGVLEKEPGDVILGNDELPSVSNRRLVKTRRFGKIPERPRFPDDYE